MMKKGDRVVTRRTGHKGTISMVIREEEKPYYCMRFDEPCKMESDGETVEVHFQFFKDRDLKLLENGK